MSVLWPSSPVDGFVWDESTDLFPASVAAAIVVPLVERVESAARIHVDHIVAFDGEEVILLFDTHHFSAFGNWKRKRDNIARFGRTDECIAPIPGELSRPIADRAADLMGFDPLTDANPQLLERLFDDDIDLTRIRDMAVQVDPLRRTIQQQVYGEFATVVAEDVLPDVVQRPRGIAGAAVHDSRTLAHEPVIAVGQPAKAPILRSGT